MADVSPEESQRRSELAKRLHAEGKLGGKEFGKLGGRPRKKRAAEIVAEKAADEAQLIVDAYIDALKSDNMNVRLQAARDWLGVELKEAELQLKEDRDFNKLNKDEIIGELVELFPELGLTITLPDSDVEELDDAA